MRTLLWEGGQCHEYLCEQKLNLDLLWILPFVSHCSTNRVRLLFVEEAETASALTFCKSWTGGGVVYFGTSRDQRQSESALSRNDMAAPG